MPSLNHPWGGLGTPPVCFPNNLGMFGIIAYSMYQCKKELRI